ncbi:MAG: AMP-binding protein [Pirellulaceae bacterium]
MHDPLYAHRRHMQQLDRDTLQRLQLTRLNQMLVNILPSNTFYADRLSQLSLPLESLEQLGQLPFTTKLDLVVNADARSVAPNRTFPAGQYVRLHQTSGTRGRPLKILDTHDDWQWWIETWQYVLDAADVTPDDRALMAFSFGPFIGFWSAYDALVYRRALVVPTGGLTTAARLQLLADTEATVVCCTPTYALRMAEVADDMKIDLRSSATRVLIVAGEPGGSIPTVRNRIEQLWGARVVDHSGATEIGPWGFADQAGTGLYVAESEFIAELVPLTSSHDATNRGELHELVLTSLGRFGSPVIRYRTGDLVRTVTPPDANNNFLFLQGGILGRADDMLVIRGVNIFPSSIEAIVREFPIIAEFAMIAEKRGPMDELKVVVEISNNKPQLLQQVAERLHTVLGLHIAVEAAPFGSLPRYEAKSRRVIDRRADAPN